MINKSECCGCHACFNVCPTNAITMIDDENGFKYPVIDKKKCINCGMCEKVCPILNKKNTNDSKNIFAYAVYNKNEKERLSSSSGGTFILLAKEILKRKGVVFGAYFDENFKVKHGYAENMQDVYKFMGSKYVQSTIGENYKKVREFLENDRYVLFTGTPCQIEGLKSYLIKDYDKLYTQDISCHGVPSPLVWEKYKEYREEKDGKKPLKINFRQKDYGWSSYSLLFQYNENSYNINHQEDLFMKAFLRNTILRDSCYKCSFKNKNRNSDITLADYWGIKNIHPEIYADKGVSLVIVNSEKGKELFECIKDNLEYIETNLDMAIKYNPSYVEASKQDKKRNMFFKNLDKLKFDKLVKRYTYKKPLFNRIKSRLKNIIKKVIKR